MNGTGQHHNGFAKIAIHCSRTDDGPGMLCTFLRTVLTFSYPHRGKIEPCGSAGIQVMPKCSMRSPPVLDQCYRFFRFST